MVATTWSSAAGSPGPLARKNAWASVASSSSAVTVHGCSVTSAPRAVRCLTIELLMPVSIAWTRTSPPHPCVLAAVGVTSRVRSRPTMEGSAASSARASSSPIAAGKTPPFIAPAWRMCRTSARVSTPVIAGTPQSISQSSQPRSASGASSRLTTSRMIAARAHTRSDSIARSDTP